ncbi:2-dehydropantoate 2-reductase [Patellaria atrata CBS 101060]|uniref:2-dehydropantoate 2-reductase n=1 Tax=Patellaria atrata CBS 101060 TaxID=1346257 RepID=A0A9P4S369_9PEZI|nr:2-dehydropantoate 2-reductase [Patellaria atrata CBS 101060]
MSRTNILIVGAGAVGAFYASRLALAAFTSVSVICRSNYSAVKASGFHVTSPQYGSYIFKPARVFANPDEARGANIEWDYIVVSTKALPDVSDDSAILAGLVRSRTVVVLIQNGLGIEAPYVVRFPDTLVLSAVTVVSAAQPEHGKIAHNRWTRISIGPYLPHLDSGEEGTKDSDREAEKQNAEFVALLQEGGVKDAEAYTHGKLQMVRWHKIAINASMNPSSVLSGGSSNNAMSLDTELAIHLNGVMEEVLATAPKVLGQPLPAEFATPERILASTRKNTSGSRPSMWFDWEKGARMELEVIMGNPIRMAREKGIEMPRLQTLYALLRMAQENRDKRQQNAEEKVL